MAGLSPQHWLHPDWEPGLTIAHLPLSHLIGCDIRAAVVDVDRTLLPGRDVRLPDSVRAWMQHAGSSLALHLFSNNPSRARISAVADQLGLSFTCGAGKPRRGALRRVMAELALDPRQVAMVGDRLFTDVLCGNRLGLTPCWCAQSVKTAHRVVTMGCSDWNDGSPAGWGRLRHDAVGVEAGDKPVAGRCCIRH